MPSERAASVWPFGESSAEAFVHTAVARTLGTLASGNVACRLIHARGVGSVYGAVADFTLDCLGHTVLLTRFRDEDTLADALSEALRRALAGSSGGDATLNSEEARGPALVVQRRNVRGAPAQWLSGEPRTHELVTEAGLCFEVRPGHQQNPGLFLDMAPGRALLRERCAGERILNLFAYTCSLSVAALAGGASHVVNVDMVRGVLNAGRRNHDLNHIPPRDVSYLAHDVLKSWGKLKRLGPFDGVILDPPSDQGRSFAVERDFDKLVRRLPELVRPGGWALTCINSPRLGWDFVDEAMAANAPEFSCELCLVPPAAFLVDEPAQRLKAAFWRREEAPL